MRKTTLYALIAAVSLGATNAAQADIITLPADRGSYPYSNGILAFSTQELTFDAATIGVINMTASAVNPGSAGSIAREKDAQGGSVSMSYQTGPASMTLDTASHAIVGFGSEGSFTWTAVPVPPITSGGTLTFSNLAVDLKTGVVRGDLAGSNGVGSLTNVAIWTVGNMSFNANKVGHNTCIPGQGCDFFGAEDFDVFELTLNAANLTMTTEARNAMTTAFGAPATGLGQQVWATAGNFSGLALQAHYEAPVGYNITAVPEPSTLAMLGVGLLAIGSTLSQRRVRR